MSAIEPVRPREPRIPVSPQLALRVAIIGGVAMVMFGVIFFRLWFLQVLSGEQYVTQADANLARHLPIPAPRGQILDRNGQPIVGSTVTNAIQIVPDELPPGISSQVAEYQASLFKAEAVRRKAVAPPVALRGRPRRRSASETRAAARARSPAQRHRSTANRGAALAGHRGHAREPVQAPGPGDPRQPPQDRRTHRRGDHGDRLTHTSRSRPPEDAAH